MSRPISSSAARAAAVPPSARAGRLDAWLLTTVDVGLASIVLVAPWFMGGRHPLGELVFVLLAVALAVSWTARQAVSPRRGGHAWSWAHLVIAAGAGLVLLQLAPLGARSLGWLSPHCAAILPLWSGAPQHALSLGQWGTVSLDPEATRGALVMFLAYAMLFIVASERIASIADVERIFDRVALATVLLA